MRLHQTGPGFPDWDDNASGMRNIDRMGQVDAILSYKAAGGCEYGRINGIDEVAKNCLIIEQFNECHTGTAGNESAELHPRCSTVVDYARQAHLGLLVYHHANDLPRIQSAADSGCKLVHIPHGADPLFAECARPWSERTGILLTGAMNPHHYPVRLRMESLIRSGRLNAALFHRPSNYTNSVEQSDALVRQYAEALGSCRVKLGCSSRWKYALQHYSEAALAGCAHVADLPEGVDKDFYKMIAQVRPDASDESLIETIRMVESGAETWGRYAHETAAAAYTTDHYAERLVSAIRECLAGM